MKSRATRFTVLCRCACLLAVLLAALGHAPTAAAHAALVSSTPGNDSVLARAPSEVELRFNEPVESEFGSVRVYDTDAVRVDAGPIVRPNQKTVSVGIGRNLPRGTYTVAWRVLSADAHPVSGAFVFHVGAPGSKPGGIAAEVGEGGTPRHVSVLFASIRFLDFALLLLATGGAVALAYPLRTAVAPLRRAMLGSLAILGVLLASVALAGIVLQGATAGGFGLSEAVRWENVKAVVETRFGTVWLVQAGLAFALGLLALIARRADRPTAALAPLVPAVALWPTLSLSGHASVRGGLTLLADVAHVTAGAVWTGGLMYVIVALLAAGSTRWLLAAEAVSWFSTLGVVSASVLIAAGVLNAYEEVGAWRGLSDTTYGLLLLAKIALVLPLLALGAYNNKYAVPRVRSEQTSPAEQAHFLRMAGAQIAVFAAVIAVTAVLVAEPPASARVAPQGPYATTVELGPLEANVVADPAQPGTNAIHVYLTDHSGKPSDVDELRVSASLPSENLGPLRFPAHRLAPGHYAVHGAQLPLDGDWQLLIEARRGEFEALTGRVAVPIRKDS